MKTSEPVILVLYASLILLAVHLFVVLLFVVLYEEPTLRREFGESYDCYCRSVPRWIPRIKHLDNTGWRRAEAGGSFALFRLLAQAERARLGPRDIPGITQTGQEQSHLGIELPLPHTRRSAMSAVLSLYEQFSRYPMGNTLFSKVLSFRAPYFSTIHPRVTELRSGHCKVAIKDRWSIRNHLGSIHAGALCTLAELTGGLAVEATLPATLRWIPKGMTVRYIKKAKGRLVGSCSIGPGVLVPGDINVPLEIRNASGESVLNAVIVFYISERRDKNRADQPPSEADGSSRTA